MIADVAADIAQRLELRQPLVGSPPLCDEAAGNAAERTLQLTVAQGIRGVGLEGVGGDLHGVIQVCGRRRLDQAARP